MARNLPDIIKNAIKSGPVPKVRDWRKIAGRCTSEAELNKRLTLAERIMFFCESLLKVPEGSLQGQALRFDLFQEVFIYAVYDNPAGTRHAYLSIARKNGKTALIAALLIAHIVGPASGDIANAQLISGAMSREQAALVYSLADKMLKQSPGLEEMVGTVPSRKSITNLYKNIEYKAISAEASTAHGLSPRVAILDELGQIVGPTSPFIEAISTAQGAYNDALLIVISTSASSDADLFSIWCDDAERSTDQTTVCHVYRADEGCELLDKNQIRKANPALGKFRSERDIVAQLEKAQRLPSLEAGARNLLLNQRISLNTLWLAPSVWKANNEPPDPAVALEYGGHLGLDLSQKNDLTAAVLACQDDAGKIHVFPYCFTPLEGIEERSRRDRVPYDQWTRDGFLYAPPGPTIDYEFVSQFILENIEQKGIKIHSIQFDDWRIADFKKAADKVAMGSFSDWVNVRQGFKSMTPRVEAMETALLKQDIRHGSHPLLNLGASSAIVVADAAGGRKLDKAKASNKIDPIIAMLMAIYPLVSRTTAENDVSWWIA